MDPSLPELILGRLTIADREGRARIIFELQADGEPAIRILASTGQELARLGLSKVPHRAHDTGQDQIIAELVLGCVDQGAQLNAQAGTHGEGFLELTSAADEHFAAVLLDVDRPSGGHRARFSVRDATVAWEVEANEGELHIAPGHKTGPPGDLPR